MARPLVALLAAGRASRFGGGKLDAPCAGKTLGQWTLDALHAAGLPPGIAVVPPAPLLFLPKTWDRIPNPSPEAGLARSVALAAQAAKARGAEALLIALADMPLMSGAFLAGLAETRAPAATRWPEGRPGVPALLPAEMFDAAIALTGDSGAGKLLAGRADLRLLEAPADMLLDVDTREDLARAERLLAAR